MVPNCMDSRDYQYILRQFEQGLPILFTGAGLCWDVVDRQSRRLPVGPQLAAELWSLALPDEPFEDGTPLADVYQLCLRYKPQDLARYLQARLTVDPNALPDYLESWFRAPWARIYSLNIDNLPEAVNHRFALRRNLAPLSATSDVVPAAMPPMTLEHIHINGMLRDLPDNVIFSRTQYAVRSATPDPWYGVVSSDICSRSVVFVGSELDEPDLWRYIQIRHLRGGRQNRELRPKSFLVLPKLNKAKALTLRDYNIIHIQATAQEFAEQVLGTGVSNVTYRGYEALTRRATQRWAPVIDVTQAERDAARDSSPSVYLEGAEPAWGDIADGRCIERSHDKAARDLLLDGADERTKRRLVTITGTAGSGKSTCLMRLAMHTSRTGLRRSWIPSDGSTDIRAILDAVEGDLCPTCMFIDDADRFGSGIHRLLDCLFDKGVVNIAVAMRSSKADRLMTLGSFESRAIDYRELICGHLHDSEIDALLNLLDREHRLGKLKGKSLQERRLAFQDVAGRQLIVAMIEATTGQKFKDKIRTEYNELSDDGATIYLAAAVATRLQSSLSRQEIIRMGGDFDNQTLNTLDRLVRSHLIREVPESGRLRLRHRVIAEEVVHEAADCGKLQASIEALAFVLASSIHPGTRRHDRQYALLRSLIQHRFLEGLLGLDGTRKVYGAIEDSLHWNAHFSLQRGSLEVAYGSLREAQRYLDMALSLDPSSWLIRTEYAYYLFRRALERPEAPEAERDVRDAMEALLDRIHSVGHRDAHPYHVIGSQGLKWARVRALDEVQRQEFLGQLYGIVSEGERRHSRDKMLPGLAREIKSEQLKNAVIDR